MGEVVVLEAVFEGALRAGGGMGEVIVEARVGSLVGDAGEAVRGRVGRARRVGRRRGAPRPFARK